MKALSERDRWLVAACVDGTLSHRERRAAVRLLHDSSEARQLYQSLRADRRSLQSLPKHSAPADLIESVLAELPEALPVHLRPQIFKPTHKSLLTSRAALAWSVLLTLSIGLLMVFLEPRPAASRATNVVNMIEFVGESPMLPSPATLPPGNPGWENVVPLDGNPARVAAQTPSKSELKPPQKDAPVKPADVMGNLPTPLPELVQVAPPRLLTVPVKSLDQAEERARVLKEFARGDALHVDLFTRDPFKALERIQTVLRERNGRSVIDAVVQETSRRKIRSQYIILSDEFTAEEWMQILQQLRAADRKTEEKRPGEAIFGHLVLMPVENADHKEIQNLLGNDWLGNVKARRGSSESEMARDANSESSRKARSDPWALVVAQAPLRTSPGSREVRQYLERRPQKAPRAVPVLLILRPAAI